MDRNKSINIWLFIISLLFFVGTRFWIYHNSYLPRADVLHYAKMAYAARYSEQYGISLNQSYQKTVSELRALERKNRNKPIPRLDKQIEYPPLFVFFAARMMSGTLPESITANSYVDYREDFRAQYLYWIATADILIFIFVLAIIFSLLYYSQESFSFKDPKNWLRAAEVVFFYSLSTIINLAIYYHRQDLFILFWLCSSIFFVVVYYQPLIALFLLALATLFKLVPVALLPLFLAYFIYVDLNHEHYRARWISRSLIRSSFFLVSLVGVSIALGLLYGFDTYQFFSYHGQRPTQMESLPALIIMILDCFGFTTKIFHDFGSWNIVSSVEPVLRIIFGLAGFLVLFLFYFWIFHHYYDWKSFLQPRLRAGVVFSRSVFIGFIVLLLASLIITSKVFSPQYLLWFFPFVALAFMTRGGKIYYVSMFLYLGICALTYAIYPLNYIEHFLDRGRGPTYFGVFLLLCRNGLFITFTYCFYKELEHAMKLSE